MFVTFKSKYNKECQAYLQQNPGIAITKYEIAKLTAKPYLKSVCPEHVVSVFRKSGIYPYNTQTITPSQVAPSVIYEKEPETIPETQSEKIPYTNSHDPETQRASESNV